MAYTAKPAAPSTTAAMSDSRKCTDPIGRKKETWATSAEWQMTALTASATASNVTINYTVKNNGEVAAPAVPIRFYVGWAYAVGGATPVLCSSTVPSLAAGASTASTQIVCPLAAGQVGSAITAWVDPTNATPEASETNNKLDYGVLMGPDLAFHSNGCCST